MQNTHFIIFPKVFGFFIRTFVQFYLKIKKIIKTFILYFSEKTVSWGRSDDRNYDFNDRVRTSYDGNMTFTMKILRVRKSDRGEYFCRANNHLGGGHNHTKTAVLKIKCKIKISRSNNSFLNNISTFQLNLRSETFHVFQNLLKTWCIKLI